MISNKHRFHGRASLRRVFQNGSSTRGRTLLIKYTTAPNRTTTRCAVIVSKKIFKSAVKRNRVRRRIFEIVRHELSTLQPGTDMVITVLTPDVLTMPHSELVSELTKLLSRLPRRSNLS
ncbi:MAG: ribonuclease P protein component [Candidatus Saccharimonadales bacterium]